MDNTNTVTVRLSRNNYDRLVKVSGALECSPDAALNLHILDMMEYPGTLIDDVLGGRSNDEMTEEEARIYANLQKLDDDGWQPDESFED